MPKAVDHAERREQIAHAACTVVAQHGFSQATVVRIARAAGYTTGMLAHYYASKREIILAALRLTLLRIEQRLTQPSVAKPDLLAVLSEALPLDESRFTECAFWTAFWGQVSTDEEVRRLNAWVHQEYARLYRRCMARHWPQSAAWPAPIRAHVLRSITTFINGLTASAVTSRADWPPDRQVAQLRMHLQLLLQWAETEAQRHGLRAPAVRAADPAVRRSRATQPRR